MMRISRPYIAIQLTAAIGVLYLVFYLPRRQAAIPSEAILSEPTIIRQKTPEGTTIEYLPGSSYASAHTRTKTIVFARPQSGDVYWLPIADSNTTIAIYVVDNPSLSPDYTIPQNKGREAMVYLTYIIDHYENLSDVSIFTHSYMISSHNNDLLDSSMLQTIQHLSLPHVARVGYFNLLCHHEPGCPDWLHLDRPWYALDKNRKMEEKAFTKAVWKELHPNVPLPKAISQPCCAQFAVSRERIHAVPKSEYMRYRDWILNTDLTDEYSGRVMEYSWQFLFAGVAELCPPMHSCYCDGYGICFGGAKELREYFDLREELKRTWKEYDDGGSELGYPEWLKPKIYDLEERVKQLKQAAFARGRDERERAMEVGRELPPLSITGEY